MTLTVLPTPPPPPLAAVASAPPVATAPAVDVAERHYFVGLDLGQAADPSALTIAEQTTPVAPTVPWATAYGQPEARYLLRALRRFPLRTPYPTIVRQVSALVQAGPLREHVTLVVDGTGVGRPVVDAFRAADLPCPVIPVLITGGTQELCEGAEGWWHVPKRNLAGVLAILLQNGRLKASPTLPDIETLTGELANFRVKIDPATAHDSYSAWRENQHDDLVLATALACWAGERGLGFDWRTMPHSTPFLDLDRDSQGRLWTDPHRVAAREFGAQLRSRITRGRRQARAERWAEARAAAGAEADPLVLAEPVGERITP